MSQPCSFNVVHLVHQHMPCLTSIIGEQMIWFSVLEMKRIEMRYITHTIHITHLEANKRQIRRKERPCDREWDTNYLYLDASLNESIECEKEMNLDSTAVRQSGKGHVWIILCTSTIWFWISFFFFGVAVWFDRILRMCRWWWWQWWRWSVVVYFYMTQTHHDMWLYLYCWMVDVVVDVVNT